MREFLMGIWNAPAEEVWEVVRVVAAIFLVLFLVTLLQIRRMAARLEREQQSFDQRFARYRQDPQGRGRL